MKPTPINPAPGAPEVYPSGAPCPDTGILSAIGRTPLVRLERLFPDHPARFWAKLEMLNPGGSMKDRPALKMLLDALRDGRLEPGGVVIESTSGNTGVGLAQACRALGLRFICVTDVKAAATNRKLMRLYGAELVVVEAPHPETGEFLDARQARIDALLEAMPGALWAHQYVNPSNPRAHAEGTMTEIVEALGRDPDVMLTATGTCGTLAGAQQLFTARGAPTRLVAVDARGSALFGDTPHKRLIPGMGSSRRAGFIDPEGVEVVHVTDEESVRGCRRLLRREAILGGGSCGAVVSAAERLRPTFGPGQDVVLLMADRGERYLDTVYDEGWVRTHIGSV